MTGNENEGTVTLKSETIKGRCNESEEDDVDSADEALCEMLGLSSLNAMKCDDTDIDINDDDHEDTELRHKDVKLYETRSSENGIPRLLTNMDEKYKNVVTSLRQSIQKSFEKDSVTNLGGPNLSIPPSIMRKLTEDLVWGYSQKYPCDITMETITTINTNTRQEHKKRVLTRFENFVNSHDGWKDLTCQYIPSLLQSIFDKHEQQWVLFKEKLNLKPPGGSGFAPHVDTPSLRVPFPNFGPKTFITVMIAIDDMHIKNGCMQFVKQKLSSNTVRDYLVQAPKKSSNVTSTSGNDNDDDDDNPDAGGRKGAIDLHVANEMPFEYWPAKAGDIVVFDGWIPHRSGPNKHYFPRRAVYLTYNPLVEGDWHDAYYDKMRQIRQEWKNKHLRKHAQISESPFLDENDSMKRAQQVNDDLVALETIPKI